jgi:hypothetical protein
VQCQKSLLFYGHVHAVSQDQDMAKDSKMRSTKVAVKHKNKQKTVREKRDVDIMNVRSPAFSTQAFLRGH